MIFHTVCDPVYFDRFYKDFYSSIVKNSEDAELSLHYVGKTSKNFTEFITDSSLHYSTEPTTLEDLKIKYHETTDIGNLLGFYPLARWYSIPIIDKDVCVCDVDILAINKIDSRYLKKLLEEHDVVNITRTKPSGEQGGMMLMCLSKRILKSIVEFANAVSKEGVRIGIAEDVRIRSYIYNNFKIFELSGKMLDVTKPKIEDSGEWFIYSKGGQGENSLRKKEKIENFLRK